MKDYYKIDFELLPEYQDLKIDCENYKLFDDIYDNNSPDIKNNNNLNNLNQINNNILNNIIYENNSSAKNINSIKDNIFNKHSPISKNSYNKINEKISFLYKKVNIPVSQNAIKKYNKNKTKRKDFSNIKLSTSRENNNSKIIATIDCFYQKNKNKTNYRNVTSNNKNNYYLKKANTSSSPYNKIPKNNLKNLCKKVTLLSKIKNIKINSFGDSDEEILLDNSNSIEKNIKNKNIEKPYIKKIVSNHEKIQEDNNNNNNNQLKENKNININININNKILYDGDSIIKDKTQNTKKILISKYLNKNNYSSMIRRKSLLHKSVSKNNKNENNCINNNFESSPTFDRKNSNYKNKYNYIPFKYNKEHFSINDNKISKNSSSKLIYIKEQEDNKNIKEKLTIKSKINYGYNPYKKNTVYNIYNSNLSTRNSYQYNHNNSKLSDSFLNIKKCHLNNDSIDKKISTSILEYNNLDKAKKYYINSYSALTDLKYINNSVSGRNKTLNNNKSYINKSNYIESYNSKKPKICQFQTIFNDSEIKDNGKQYLKYTEINNGNFDIKHKNYSNYNLLDYSTGASNEKNVI